MENNHVNKRVWAVSIGLLMVLATVPSIQAEPLEVVEQTADEVLVETRMDSCASATNDTIQDGGTPDNATATCRQGVTANLQDASSREQQLECGVNSPPSCWVDLVMETVCGENGDCVESPCDGQDLQTCVLGDLGPDCENGAGSEGPDEQNTGLQGIADWSVSAGVEICHVVHSTPLVPVFVDVGSLPLPYTIDDQSTPCYGEWSGTVPEWHYEVLFDASTHGTSYSGRSLTLSATSIGFDLPSHDETFGPRSDVHINRDVCEINYLKDYGTLRAQAQQWAHDHLPNGGDIAATGEVFLGQEPGGTYFWSTGGMDGTCQLAMGALGSWGFSCDFTFVKEGAVTGSVHATGASLFLQETPVPLE